MKRLCVLILAIAFSAPAWSQGDSYLATGKEQAGRGDYKAAIESYKKALESNPKMADAFYEMGVAYNKLNDSEAALAAYRSAARDILFAGQSFTVVFDGARLGTVFQLQIEYISPRWGSGNGYITTHQGMQVDTDPSKSVYRLTETCNCAEHPGVWTVNLKDRNTGKVLAATTFRVAPKP